MPVGAELSFGRGADGFRMSSRPLPLTNAPQALCACADALCWKGMHRAPVKTSLFKPLWPYTRISSEACTPRTYLIHRDIHMHTDTRGSTQEHAPFACGRRGACCGTGPGQEHMVWHRTWTRAHAVAQNLDKSTWYGTGPGQEHMVWHRTWTRAHAVAQNLDKSTCCGTGPEQ